MSVIGLWCVDLIVCFRDSVGRVVYDSDGLPRHGTQFVVVRRCSEEVPVTSVEENAHGAHGNDDSSQKYRDNRASLSEQLKEDVITQLEQ